MIDRARREPGAADWPPRLRLKMHFRLLADGVVLAYAEPRVICRDPRSAEWAAFEAWAATPGNIVEIAPAAAGAADSQAA
jgi:hypothetical protein